MQIPIWWCGTQSLGGFEEVTFSMIIFEGGKQNHIWEFIHLEAEADNRGMNHDELYFVGVWRKGPVFACMQHISESSSWQKEKKTLSDGFRWFLNGRIHNKFILQPESVYNPTYALSLTCLCPKSLRMVASFLVLAYWRWATMAGLGSLQSTESRWSHISACCRWGCFRLGSKQWTSHPAFVRERSRDRSSTPNLQPTQYTQDNQVYQMLSYWTFGTS